MGSREIHLAPITPNLLNFLVIWFAFSRHLFTCIFLWLPFTVTRETQTGNNSPKATWFVKGRLRSHPLALTPDLSSTVFSLYSLFV
jgi:hypothetical protein